MMRNLGKKLLSAAVINCSLPGTDYTFCRNSEEGVFSVRGSCWVVRLQCWSRAKTDRGYKEVIRRKVTGVEMSIMCVAYSRGEVRGLQE